MTAFGIYNQHFGRCDEVVARHIRVRRAGRVLQPYAHEHRSRDEARKILYVEVAQIGIHPAVGKAEARGFLLDGRCGPAHNTEIVGIITQKRDVGSYRAQASVGKRSCDSFLEEDGRVSLTVSTICGRSGAFHHRLWLLSTSTRRLRAAAPPAEAIAMAAAAKTIVLFIVLRVYFVHCTAYYGKRGGIGCEHRV